MGDRRDATLGRGRGARREDGAADDVVALVLNEMLAETLALMDQAASVGEATRNVGPTGAEAALSLRLAARLARVGGWLLANAPAAEEAGSAERAEARAQASAALAGAVRREGEGADRFSPSGKLAAKIDRLVARALRLDRLLAGDEAAEFFEETEADAAPRDAAEARRPSAVILPFRRR